MVKCSNPIYTSESQSIGFLMFLDNKTHGDMKEVERSEGAHVQLGTLFWFWSSLILCNLFTLYWLKFSMGQKSTLEIDVKVRAGYDYAENY